MITDKLKIRNLDVGVGNDNLGVQMCGVGSWKLRGMILAFGVESMDLG